MSNAFDQQNDPTPYINSVPGLSKPDPSPTAPSYTEQRLDLAQKQGGIEDKAISSIESAQAQRKALEGRRTPVPADPKLSNIPEPPKQDFTDPIKAFQNPAVVIATLGSLFSRAPMTAALNAGGAAMEAYHKGEAETFAMKREEWKEASEKAREQNQKELELYNAQWKKHGAAVADKMAEMQAIAAGVKDEVMIAGLKTGQLERIDKILEAREKANDKLEEIHAKENAIDPGVVENNAQLISSGAMPPVTGYGLRSKGGAATMARVYDINPNYRAEDYYASKAAKIVESTAEGRANSAALTAITKQKAAVDSYEGLARKNGEVLLGLADKVDRTGIPVIEKWLRAGMKATGDPDVSKFDTQIQIYRAEVARILTNPNLTGVLTDSSRHEAEGFLQGGISSEQLKAVVNLLNGDFDRRKQSIQTEIDNIKGQLHGKPAVQSGPTKVNTPAEAQALPPGTHYVTPDGQEFTR